MERCSASIRRTPSHPSCWRLSRRSRATVIRPRAPTGGGAIYGPASSAYTRIVPSDAIELTAVFLDRNVTAILARKRDARASPQQEQDLAAVIHLCGTGPARAFARRGFICWPASVWRHQFVAIYLANVNTMKRQFLRLAAAAA